MLVIQLSVCYLMNLSYMLHYIKLRKITVSHIFVFFKVHKMKLNYLYMSLRVSNVDHVRFKLPTTFTFCTRVFQEKLDVTKTIYIFCQYDNRMPKMYFFSSRKPLKKSIRSNPKKRTNIC